MILHQLKDEINLKSINDIQTGNVTNVSDNTLSTILTLNASQDHKIARISCSSDAYAKYQLFIDNVLVETKISAPNYAIDFNFDPTLLLSNGQILDVKVTHFYTSETVDFESTIYSIV